LNGRALLRDGGRERGGGEGECQCVLQKTVQLFMTPNGNVAPYRRAELDPS
jgi:hypothetical protein